MLKKIFSVFVICSILLSWQKSAYAQTLELIRDAETENAIRMFASPIFSQAGVDPAAVHIHLVNDPQLNAFVAVGLHLFINTGLIVKTENAGQLIGVIAHESGHIAGGHLVRGREAIENASTVAIVGALAGLGLMVAGASQSSHSYDAMRRGDPFGAQSGSNYVSGGAAAMMAGQDAAMKNYFSFSRSIEGSADSAGLEFLDNLHQSSRGLLEFMQTLEGQELLSSSRRDPYIRTHPVTSERVDAIRHHVETSQWSDAPVPSEYVEPHARIRAKILAYQQLPATTLYMYKDSDHSLVARYARAVAYYRKPDLTSAVPLIDGLISEHPRDPYFHELKGQMLMESGRLREAITEYKLAVKYLPDNSLLRSELGFAQTEIDDPAELKGAKENLDIAVRLDPEDAMSWRELSIVYTRLGDPTMVEASMAEYSMLSGHYKEAYRHAENALKGLKSGSSVAIRMRDLRSQAEQLQITERNNR